MDRDPLADDEPRPPGPCQRCAGGGWVQVLPAYARHMVPDPAPELLAICGPEQAAELHRQVEQRRAAAADSWYPCRDCNPRAFFRWAEGHWGPTHDVGGCAECIDALGGTKTARRAARTQRTVPDAPPRKDLE